MKKKCIAHPELYDFIERKYHKQRIHNMILDFVVAGLVIIMVAALLWLVSLDHFEVIIIS